VAYVAALIPVRFPLSGGFELLFLLVGVMGVVVLIAAAANWAWFRAIAYGGVLVTLALYAAYWSSIASTVLSHKPEYGLLELVSRLSENISLLVDRHLAAGAYWGAARLFYFEVIAPSIQVAVGIWLLVTGRGSSSGPLQSNPTPNADARKSGARRLA